MNWRTERGLWMLAVFFLMVNCAIYALIFEGLMEDRLRGAQVAAADLDIYIDLLVKHHFSV